VMFLRLCEMLIDAGEIFAMAFLRMVPNQNWSTERNHFKWFPGGEMSPGCNVCVLFGELAKARSFCCAFRFEIVHALKRLGCNCKVCDSIR
jgi:hypothetical protein